MAVNPEHPQIHMPLQWGDLYFQKQTYSDVISRKGSWMTRRQTSPHHPRTNAHLSGESSGDTSTTELCWLNARPPAASTRYVFQSRRRHRLHHDHRSTGFNGAGGRHPSGSMDDVEKPRRQIADSADLAHDVTMIYAGSISKRLLFCVVDPPCGILSGTLGDPGLADPMVLH